MKILVAGFGKCGARMVLDLNCQINGGKNSYELRVTKGDKVGLKGKLEDLLRELTDRLKWTGEIYLIHPDEVPLMHMGDCDPDNEITAGFLTSGQTTDQGNDDAGLSKLVRDKVVFSNYQGACGQYHSIGEMVMDNLLSTSPEIYRRLVDEPVGQPNRESMACYLCCFSLGGGTGCGTSTALISRVNALCEDRNRILFTAGIAVLPERLEGEMNYSISAGRFITKYLADKFQERTDPQGRSITFDTVLTISNSIIRGIDHDKLEIEAKVNTLATSVIGSMINSSSRFVRATRNTDAAELKRYIVGPAFFCYAQQEPEQSKGVEFARIVTLFQRAISPVHMNLALGGHGKIRNFEGVSIDLTHEDHYPKERWEKLVEDIAGLTDEVNGNTLGDAISQIAGEPTHDLPLPMRTARRLTVLMGICENSHLTGQQEEILMKLARRVFPYAEPAVYQSYLPANLRMDTLTLIASPYISYELIELMVKYFGATWMWDGNEEESQTKFIYDLFLRRKELPVEDIERRLGGSEDFGLRFPDYRGFERKMKERFGLTDEQLLAYRMKSESIFLASKMTNDILSPPRRVQQSSEPIPEL